MRGRRHALRRWHRYTGGVASVFLVVLAFSGFVINHVDDLGLADTQLTWRPLLQWYGLAQKTGPVIAFQVDGKPIAWADGMIRLGQSRGGLDIPFASEPVGVVSAEPLIVVAAEREMLLLSGDGSVVERLQSENLPGDIARLGQSDGMIYTLASGRLYRTNSSFLGWKAAASTIRPGDIDWSIPAALTGRALRQWQEGYQGEGLPLERVLLDIHSGRFWGNGRWLSDLAAVAILFLILSGLINWRRRG